jgi:hypothetical protein
MGDGSTVDDRDELWRVRVSPAETRGGIWKDTDDLIESE